MNDCSVTESFCYSWHCGGGQSSQPNHHPHPGRVLYRQVRVHSQRDYNSFPSCLSTPVCLMSDCLFVL